MLIVQYTMSIPKDKQPTFIQYAKEVLKPTWKKYGCQQYECAKIEENPIVGRQIMEQNRFIERMYFDDDFDLPTFYQIAKKNESEKAKSYEEKFGAYWIELRILRRMA